jgi:hypothetical protein
MYRFYGLDVKKHYPKDWVVLQNRVVECLEVCHLMKSVYLSWLRL